MVRVGVRVRVRVSGRVRVGELGQGHLTEHEANRWS